jgi:hypothetical protein
VSLKGRFQPIEKVETGRNQHLDGPVVAQVYTASTLL